MLIEIPQLPGRDLVHSDKKRREAQTKGQVAKTGNLLFCLGLHRLFAHRYNLLSRHPNKLGFDYFDVSVFCKLSNSLFSISFIASKV